MSEQYRPRGEAVLDVAMDGAAGDVAGDGRDDVDHDPHDTSAFSFPGRAWHAMPAGEVLAALAAGPGGLSSAVAAARRRTPPMRHRRVPPWLSELAESVFEPLQLLLIAVGVLSAIFGEISDAVAIFVVIAAVAVIETLTEMRAERAIDALRDLSAPVTRVLRDEIIAEVPTADLVPGDVLVVEAGDRVGADARVLGGSGLRVDESTLTGEAQPVGKGPGEVLEDTPLADRTGMIYAGTAVVGGTGRAVAVAVGPDSELGRLGRAVAEEKEPATPLQRSLADLARVVLVIAVAVSVLVPAVGVLTGQPLRDMLLAGLTLAFATVPEELPILVTVLLAVGGRQLASRGALLRRLRAGEALGAVTYVLTDKTGTLTHNQLTLAEIVGDPREVLQVALGCLDPDSAASSREPMDVELAHAAAAQQLAVPGSSVAVFPFDPATKTITRIWTTTTHASPLSSGPSSGSSSGRCGDSSGIAFEGAGTYMICTTGAPEAVLDRCALQGPQRADVEQDLSALTQRGLRVVAFARRVTDHIPATRQDAEQQLAFVGLVAFADPLRDGVTEAVEQLRGAGVATLMVTGDHPTTAAAIARDAGLRPSHVLLGGQHLAAVADEQLIEQLRDGTVIARATPSDKLRLVRLLQRRREVVAVTGDGVNDAPALAAADVGIAMGRRGSDLARDAAGVVLTDDAYPTVAAAVAKGRNITAQLRRAVAFYLGAKIALVVAVLVPLALGQPAPFAPVHIVLLELFMDLGASVAFVAEPAAPDAMRRPPRPPGARFLDRPEQQAIAAVAVALTTATLPPYLLLLLLQPTLGETAARAGAVLGWLAGHALIAWTLRAQPALPWRANPAFPAWATAATAVGLLAALTPLGALIRLEPLTPAHLLVVAGCVLTAAILAAGLTKILHLARRL